MSAQTSKPNHLPVVVLCLAIVAVVFGGTIAVLNRVSTVAREQRAAAEPPSEGGDGAGNFRLGQTLPDFTLAGRTDDAPAFRLADALDGEHFVLINFHHPDCPCAANCGRLLADMMKQADYADLRVVGVMATDTRDARAAEALEEQIADGVVTYPVYLDHDGAVRRLLGATRTPEVWLLDKQGRIAFYGAPETTLAPGTASHRYILREALDALRAGREPEVRRMDPFGCLMEPEQPVAGG